MRSPNGHNGGGHNNHRRNNSNNNNNRGPRPHNGGGSSSNNNGGNRRGGATPQNLRNQIFDSHGPGGERVRGNAFQVHEKYLSLAREAEERIDQENYYQHAEHYYRIVEAIQEMEAEQRSRFTVVESADPFAGSTGDTFGEQPDLAASEQPQAQPQAQQQQAQYQPRPQRQPNRGPVTTEDAFGEPNGNVAPASSEPMFSIGDDASTDETPDTEGGDTPRGRPPGRGTRRGAVTA